MRANTPIGQAKERRDEESIRRSKGKCFFHDEPTIFRFWSTKPVDGFGALRRPPKGWSWRLALERRDCGVGHSRGDQVVAAL
eukprot:886559-Pyramimonas_sp.AAC.1